MYVVNVACVLPNSEILQVKNDLEPSNESRQMKF